MPVVDGLALLSHLARRGTLREDLRPWLRGWPDGIFTRLGHSAPSGEIHLGIEWGHSQYELVLRAGERSVARFSSTIPSQYSRPSGGTISLKVLPNVARMASTSARSARSSAAESRSGA